MLFTTFRALTHVRRAHNPHSCYPHVCAQAKTFQGKSLQKEVMGLKQHLLRFYNQLLNKQAHAYKLMSILDAVKLLPRFCICLIF